MRSMKWIAVLSATSAALAYAGIPVEFKRAVLAGLGVTTMLLALYNVLRYGPLVQGIERRAATRAATKTNQAQKIRIVETPVVSPVVTEEVVDEDAEHYHRIAISRSTAARPPRTRRTPVVRRVVTEHEAPSLVTMLPVEDKVISIDESTHS